MSTETRLAFDHPDARAAATPPGDTPPDRISLRDHVVAVEIGAFQSERGATQRLSFNIVVEVAPHDGAASDDVDTILSYDTITEAIADELAAERLNLLETLAERIAERILTEPQPLRVFVRIEKLDRGPGALGVEIVRARVENAPSDAEDLAPRPRILHLGNDVIDSPELASFLDRLQDGGPVILCVDIGETPPPVAPRDAAQRRIDLLAIEQNAWRLAGRDERCVVVGTRTELDWGLKHGQISVWAPSKLVLDAVEGPTGPVDPRALSRWFAEGLDAQELTILGADDMGQG
ncbi:dihydroneopterin aldolase [Aliiroseovarius subalbicans]|uniref:dihydroneopterin aldolase n=1 Tax=Aliiroseovarius subalbicans TaxID=2925840 RepID=UPI001F5A7BD0|nr:dihydroneopterin aldolase [Aliiroseovarius subalbicans]MCI2399316.1 dihydroneopterin aldolase [Aliiroseovarius subalbicans]